MIGRVSFSVDTLPEHEIISVVSVPVCLLMIMCGVDVWLSSFCRMASCGTLCSPFFPIFFFF